MAAFIVWGIVCLFGSLALRYANTRVSAHQTATEPPPSWITYLRRAPQTLCYMGYYLVGVGVFLIAPLPWSRDLRLVALLPVVPVYFAFVSHVAVRDQMTADTRHNRLWRKVLPVIHIFSIGIMAYMAHRILVDYFPAFARTGNDADVSVILAVGGDPNDAFEDAVHGAHLSTIQLLVSHGADVNRAWTTAPVWTALDQAAHDGNIPIAPYLVTHGASVNTGGPLDMAALTGNIAMAQLMVASGANPNTITPWGGYPLITAADTGHAQIVSFLLAHGAAVHVVDQRGRSAMFYAQRRRHEDIVKILTSAADVQPAAQSQNVSIGKRRR